MKKLTLILLCLLPVMGAFSQAYLGHPKSTVRSGLKRYIKTHGLTNSLITEQGDTITLRINDPATQPATFRYIFDEGHWCIAEQKTSCDKCVAELLKTILATEKYEWVKINETTYVSKYSKKRKVQVTDGENGKCVEIAKIKWGKIEYEQWLAAKK